jgi:hypothetical protein
MEHYAPRGSEAGVETDERTSVRPGGIITARGALSPVDVGRGGSGDQIDIPAR